MAKPVALGRKIRKLRTDRKLSQKDLAGRLGISASYLNLIEHDQRPITVSLLLKIGKQFGIDVEELTGDSENSSESMSKS
ncbi:MAG: helix-turn-helix transcriptional regulator [Pseudomonadota bacterium]